MSLAAPAAPRAVSSGTLLAGKVAYRQYQDGYRTGIEPVLLAASVPARPGDRVLEGGTGAGAGLLCLAARIGALSGVGLEIDPELAALARANFGLNSQPGLVVDAQDLTAWRTQDAYDHAFANPPWHRANATPSPDPGRRMAKQASAGGLPAWCAALAAPLRPGGTLSLILPAADIGAGIAALQSAGCPQITVIPFWPRADQAARLVILRATRLGAGDCILLPGLALHTADGGYTRGADAILRDGLSLEEACRPAGTAVDQSGKDARQIG